MTEQEERSVCVREREWARVIRVCVGTYYVTTQEKNNPSESWKIICQCLLHPSLTGSLSEDEKCVA